MAGAMSLLLYLAVLVVSVTSVLFGLDWLSTPPPPPSKPPVQVARTHTHPAPPATKPVKSVAPVQAVKPAPRPAAVAATPAPTADVSQTATIPPKPEAVGFAPPDAASPSDAAATPAPRCDVQACEVAYRSFRASDCTWQPFDGPRRFCDKGTPPAKADRAGAGIEATAAQAQAQAQAQAPSCNIKACGRAYLSFDAADCTYQPYEGPRQLCAK